MSSLLLDYNRYTPVRQCWSDTIIYMKKTWVIIGGVVVVIAAAFLYLTFSGGKVSLPNNMRQPDDAQAQAQKEAERLKTQMPAQSGVYRDFEGGAFEQDRGKVRQVVFFHAPWCPQCRELDKSIKEGTVPAGVVIYKLDFDTSSFYRKLYGVTQQTTFVEIDKDGQLVNRFNAYYEPNLAAVIKGLDLK